MFSSRRDEHPFSATVRYRTVGDMTCTGAVESQASTLEEVVMEIAATKITERGQTRADDRVTEAAMEDRKRDGLLLMAISDPAQNSHAPGEGIAEEGIAGERIAEEGIAEDGIAGAEERIAEEGIVDVFERLSERPAELLRFATAGSVDDGKSTLIGRLLYDSKQVLADQLEHVEQTSRRMGSEAWTSRC